MRVEFRGLTEGRPGAAWRSIFADGWPGWSKWFLANGGATAPRLDDCQRALRRFMPEMVRLLDDLVAEVGGDEDVARFLSFWMPPRYLVSCSQLAVTDSDGPLLVRNYDLDPRLNEATMLHSAWRGRRVMGMVEGLAGLADGMNDCGLAASLTFGGRTVAGRGFGVPLIMRYVLETCRDAVDAREALRAVPCHMSYNITVADRSGDWATAFLAPDRPTILSDRPLATNHQLGVEWAQHGRMTRTEVREQHLRSLVDSGATLTGRQVISEFLRDPLFSTDYQRGFGTVYTTAYRPAAGEVSLRWRDDAPLLWSIADFRPQTASVLFSEAGSRIAAATPSATGFLGSQGHAASGHAVQAPSLSEILAELSECLAGRRNWASMGLLWARGAQNALPQGEMR